MSKNKLLIKWGSNSSSDSDSRKTHSMSCKEEEEQKPIPVPLSVKKKSPKVVQQKVKKDKGKKENMPDDIMRKFLEEKDKQKWNFFVDNLDKKDADVLKRLLTNTSEEEESNSSGQQPPNKKKCVEVKKENTDSESDGKK